ncbi:TPA: FRG domain-containing protein [Vibrio parahaemolyticus]|uniref:FRG domain-containing protein n=1 Tax=Vibrio parahaemolyticus TaxID=670 RepID=UPI000423DDEE|nr:FRG domain-containing protein [Vibrio parahaemolyticus]HBH7871705.1 FRG domain-containing protein [Vibrio parahaemolyticus]HBN6096050.1 FRG domain-containing protein [Vibrio parahaemolyticus]HBN6185447.1 FRG domain-containing protein [Vibrio parahaemolyticus]HCD5127187.1 FRG domain-containing protein [Vibrio parahaemolyticus]HCD5137208.1 FRG domain-containing protein [Vibrio parahaemolyticus]
MKETSLFLNQLNGTEDISLFRGQANADWKLLPSIARLSDKYKVRKECFSWKSVELRVMREFEKHASLYLSKTPKNELEWLIHAQHHGLPTRLLDWSSNPLKALFFAVENPVYDAHDGAVYALEPVLHIIMERFVKSTGSDKVIAFDSSSLNPRVTAQEGCFTITPLPEQWDDFIEIVDDKRVVEKLYKFVIPKQHKPQLRNQLNSLGINHRFLFPDLDGLSMSIKRSIGA